MCAKKANLFDALNNNEPRCSPEHGSVHQPMEVRVIPAVDALMSRLDPTTLVTGKKLWDTGS